MATTPSNTLTAQSADDILETARRLRRERPQPISRAVLREGKVQVSTLGFGAAEAGGQVSALVAMGEMRGGAVLDALATQKVLQPHDEIQILPAPVCHARVHATDGTKIGRGDEQQAR